MRPRPQHPIRQLALHSLAATLLLASCLGAAVPAAAADPLELKIKAAFLFNFARFVTWPPAKFAGADSPIELCVLGDAYFSGILSQTVQGKSVASRPLRVSLAYRAGELRHCHIVYLGAGVAPDEALQALAGAGVLTVHEAESARPGGVIRFFLEQRHVRFEVNATAAAREDLQLSSKLLAVARVVQL